jgi:hypothetical protein
MLLHITCSLSSLKLNNLQAGQFEVGTSSKEVVRCHKDDKVGLEATGADKEVSF